MNKVYCRDCKYFYYDQDVGSMGWGLCYYMIHGKGLVKTYGERVFVHEKFSCQKWEKRKDSQPGYMTFTPDVPLDKSIPLKVPIEKVIFKPREIK